MLLLMRGRQPLAFPRSTRDIPDAAINATPSAASTPLATARPRQPLSGARSVSVPQVGDRVWDMRPALTTSSSPLPYPPAPSLPSPCRPPANAGVRAAVHGHQMRLSSSASGSVAAAASASSSAEDWGLGPGLVLGLRLEIRQGLGLQRGWGLGPPRASHTSIYTYHEHMHISHVHVHVRMGGACPRVRPDHGWLYRHSQARNARGSRCICHMAHLH